MTDQLTATENASIRKFIEQAGSEGYLAGRVLDYGCGKQPYRNLVESYGGHYTGLDRASNPMNQFGDVNPELFENNVWAYGDRWDTIMCTQVLQYLTEPVHFIRRCGYVLGAWGQKEKQPKYIVMTYPTNWPEVQEEDLWRFTKAGMEKILYESGFDVVMHQRRAVMSATIEATRATETIDLAYGYGVVAKA